MSGPSAAALTAALTSSTVVSRADGDGQVGGRAGRDRHAQREAVELALELRQHQADRLGGAGRGRHDVDARRRGRGAGPCAGRPAGSGPACTRGSWSSGPARCRTRRSGPWPSAPGSWWCRTRCEMIVCFAGSYMLVVDAHHDGDVLVLGRRRDDDLLGAAVDVRPGLGGVGEEAGRLDDDVGAEVAPGQLGRVALGEDLDVLPSTVISSSSAVTSQRQPAQDGVVLEQVGQGRVVGQVVDGDDLDVGAGGAGPPGRSCGRCGRSR